MRGGRKATKYSSKMKKGSMTPTYNEVVKKKTGGKV